MNRAAYLAIQSRLHAEVPELEYISMFNNQLKMIEDGDTYIFPMPCALIEFIAPIDTERLGNGVSKLNLTVRVHLAHPFTNAMDGTQELNLDVFDLKDKIILALEDFEGANMSSFVCTSEEPNYDHNDTYIYIIDFQTTFIRNIGLRPRNSITGTITTFEDNITIQH